MRKLAELSEDDTRSLEIITNKVACAQQALRPDSVPVYAPKSAADKFFREALFALADARYLRESFWRDVARQYGVAAEDRGRLYVDFSRRALLLG